MDLEKLSVRLRPRKPWEAVDLGFAMVRQWRGTVYPPWLALTVTTALALIWLLSGWGLLIFWWLLPLFEAMVLWPLSRAVFGELPTPGQSLRAAPMEMKRAWREVLIRRFDLARSFALPIGQLEGLKGSERRLRRSVLSRSIEVHGGVTVVFFCFELLLMAAFFTLLVSMTPTWMGIDWDGGMSRFFEGLSAGWVYKTVFSFCALILIAVDPFYVAAGFALYLDRRTALEGWDLEIAFRRLARRLHRMEAARAERVGSEDGRTSAGRASAGRAASWIAFGVAAALAVLSCLAVQPLSAQDTVAQGSDAEDVAAENVAAEDVAAEESLDGEEAEEPPPAVWDGDEEDDPRQVAREIVSQPEFGGTVTSSRWQLKEDLRKWLERADSEADPEPASKPHPILLGLAWFVFRLGEFILWIVLGLVLVALVVLAVRKWPRSSKSADGPDAAVPETLFGLDLRAESLPPDIASEAEALWANGDVAGALSLLYRGALKRLADDGVSLSESFTEDDCLRAARGVLEPMRTGFFAELTRAWQLVAYGHKLPDDGDGERWFGGWRRHFGRAAQKGTS